MADFYTPTGVPAANSGPTGTSAAMRGELTLIKTSISDKLAPYTGNGGKTVKINAAGTAYEVSKVVITEPATSATLTIPDGVTFTGPSASGTAATLAGAETLSNKTLVAPALGTPLSGVATNLTGTAAGLSIGGNAATATTATTATNTGGKTTIASAATPDIFATSVGTIIDYTGVATCTGFAAAPQAGATKRLICAGACLFTAGANLLIEGIPSGTTITLAANAIVDVTAITTTLFKMTYSVSGTTSSVFIFNGAGGGSTGTLVMTWLVMNGVVTLFIPTVQAISGTGSSAISNGTTLPACVWPKVNCHLACNHVVNGGVQIASPGIVFLSSSGLISISRDGAQLQFTNATNCGISSPMNCSFKIA